MKPLNIFSIASRLGTSTLALLMLCQVGNAQTDAQKDYISSTYNTTKSAQYQADLKTTKDAEKQAAVTYAQANDIPLTIDMGQERQGELQRIMSDGTPIYYVVGNSTAAKTTRATSLNSGGSLGLNVNGQNMTIGVWDGGPLRTSHVGFSGRASQGDGVPFTSPNGNNGHANHVAGTVAASLNAGNGYARGMAYQASVVGYDWNNDLSEAASAASNGLLVSNHSYGYGVVDGGGRLQIPRHWIGKYDETASDWDNLMYNYPYYQMVNAAGNDRGFQASITNKGGFDLLTGHSCSKNAIVVAAAYSVPNYTGPNSVQMSNFSNWGPTDDGRIKPDIAGKGVDVYSVYSNSNSSYATLSGTSMASPNVTGTLALLQQLYNETYGGNNFMYASMLRGLALHTADEAGPATGPDYMFGWGLMNAEAAGEAILNAHSNSGAILSSEVLNNGQSYTLNVVAAGNAPLEVTICWTDPKGNANNTSTVDDATPVLMNDLDLRLDNGTTYYPWRLNPGNPSAAATQGDNSVDNIEKVYIANPTAGATYTITVNHKGNLLGSNQRFALIATGLSSNNNGGGNTGGGNNGGGSTSSYCASSGNSVADEWIAGVIIDNFTNNTPAQPSSGYSDFTSQTIGIETGSIPVTLTPGHSSTVYNEYWKIWIDLNEDGDFDDAGEEVFDAGAASSTAVSGNMTIPASAAGVTTRLRVVMRYNVAPDACGAYDYGETEDYTVTITAPSNGGGGGGGTPAYCSSESNNSTYEWISAVQIGSFSNNSGASNYSDFTGSLAPANIVTGPNAVILTPKYSNSTYNEHWKIWIDFNEDGDFDDAGEEVFADLNGSTTAVSGTMTIPSSASGLTTRMRIVMSDNSTVNPCGGYSYGETEDYLVTITGGGNNGGGSAPTGYCDSKGNNNQYEWIDLVEFGGISNSSAADAGGYGDYTNLTGSVTVGTSPKAYFSAGFQGQSYDEYWRIWIDFNRDGDFDDAGELLVSGSSSSSGTLSASLNIPANASTGLTRMRVSMKYKETAEPCETFSYGEVEDYTIDLVSSSAALWTLAPLSDQGQAYETLGSDAPLTIPVINVYPNPAVDNIILDLERFDTEMDYQIINIHGQVLQTGRLLNRQTRFDVSEFVSGTYFIRATDGENTLTQKFIKK
ncbi:MAG: GEVED domain-containing protein [Saprospiraceae bacterium]|nr:GEVED domain-containing protein [Saprospiraceae bacterium]